MSGHRKPVNHPNRLPFGGVLTRVDQPSDGVPYGARGHRVVLTSEAAQEAIPSLIGMAVAFKEGWDGHDPRRKCGVITHAEVIRDELRIVGYLYDHDFPEVAEAIRSMDMGMSHELLDIHIDDLRAAIWTFNRVTFSGAAIMLRLKAAYHSTSIKLVE